MSLIDDLKSQIAEGKISFDTVPSGTADRLKQELLGENSGTTVTSTLQKLVLDVSKLNRIRISSIIRNEGHHSEGRAFDVGNEDIATALLQIVATDMKVVALKIDESSSMQVSPEKTTEINGTMIKDRSTNTMRQHSRRIKTTSTLP